MVSVKQKQVLLLEPVLLALHLVAVDQQHVQPLVAADQSGQSVVSQLVLRWVVKGVHSFRKKML